MQFPVRMRSARLPKGQGIKMSAMTLSSTPATDATSAGPDPIDVAVGGRIRARRTALGISQTALAKALGLTFQQVQKYERGANRISASKLFEIARALQVPIGWFFEGLNSDADGEGQGTVGRGSRQRHR